MALSDNCGMLLSITHLVKQCRQISDGSPRSRRSHIKAPTKQFMTANNLIGEWHIQYNYSLCHTPNPIDRYIKIYCMSITYINKWGIDIVTSNWIWHRQDDPWSIVCGNKQEENTSMHVWATCLALYCAVPHRIITQQMIQVAAENI